jgi:serine/threonine protein kinase
MPYANTQKNEPVVFKVYEGTHAEALYAAETGVYLKVRSQANEYITKHFACFSFEGKQKFVIVLEYAAGGSLLDFLQNTPLPVEPDDFHLLWGRLSKLLDALEVLHYIYSSDRQPQWLLAGWVEIMTLIKTIINHS